MRALRSRASSMSSPANGSTCSTRSGESAADSAAINPIGGKKPCEPLPATSGPGTAIAKRKVGKPYTLLGLPTVRQLVEQHGGTVDVESRIASLRASVVRVRGLLAQSGNVAQLALVEGELARREAELEALLGQQRVLRDQVDLATLTVHMSQDAAPSPSDDAPGFADGLRRGWVAAVDGGRITLAVAGFVLPFAVPLALVALGVRRWQRRRPAAAPAD